MSNLGWYQIMTTVAKKVGGPLNLAGIFVGSGVLIGVGGSAIKNKIVKELDKKMRRAKAAVIYTVRMESKSKEGLSFKVGERFKVLEKDGDAALIEKLGETNNPYFVSAEFLRFISDYR